MACSCGAGDAAVLSCVFWNFTVRSTAISRSGAVLYLLVPFLLVAAGLCYLLGHAEAGTVLCGLCGNVRCASSFLAAGEYCPVVFRQNFSLGFGAVSVSACWPLGHGNAALSKKVCAVTVQAGLCIHCTDREKTWRASGVRPSPKATLMGGCSNSSAEG